MLFYLSHLQISTIIYSKKLPTVKNLNENIQTGFIQYLLVIAKISFLSNLFEF